MPDSRGHGTSGGDLVTYGLLEKYDVLAWAHWLKQQGCHSLFGLGESMGASVLIQAESQEHVFDAVVAESPFSTLTFIARYRAERISQLPHVLGRPASIIIVAASTVYAHIKYSVNLNQVSPLASIRTIQTPVLLIHGAADDLTPSSESLAMAAANPRVKLWLIPGGRHVSAWSMEPVEFPKRVLAWLSPPPSAMP